MGGLLCHGGPARIQITRSVAITPQSAVGDKTMVNFLRSMFQMITDRLDVLGCNVAATEEGRQMLKDIEGLMGIVAAGSDDKTSAVGAGADTTDGQGDLFLETAGVDVTEDYFDPIKIKEWKGVAILAEVAANVITHVIVSSLVCTIL